MKEGHHRLTMIRYTRAAGGGGAPSEELRGEKSASIITC